MVKDEENHKTYMCFTQNKIKRYKIAATEAAAAKIQCIYCG